VRLNGNLVPHDFHQLKFLRNIYSLLNPMCKPRNQVQLDSTHTMRTLVFLATLAILSLVNAQDPTLDLTGFDSCIAPETNVNYFGNDLESADADSLSVCCEYCQVVPDCVVYTWDSKANKCYAKTSADGSREEPGFHSAALDIDDQFFDEDGNWICNQQPGFRFTGGKQIDESPVDSEDECCNFCSNIIDCVSYNYEQASGKCTAYSTKGTKEARAGFSSGEAGVGAFAVDGGQNTFTQAQQQNIALSTPLIAVYCSLVVIAVAVIVVAIFMVRRREVRE